MSNTPKHTPESGVDSPQTDAGVSRRTALGGVAAAVMTAMGINGAEAKASTPAPAEPVALRPAPALRPAEPSPRTRHASVALPNGLVMAIGGVNPKVGKKGLTLNSVQMYDPVSNVWFNAAPLQTARSEHAAVALPDGRVVALGGFHDHSLSSVEVYDPVSDVWTYAAPMPSRRQGHAAVLAGEYIIITGGGEKNPLSCVDVFHPASNTWLLRSAL